MKTRKVIKKKKINNRMKNKLSLKNQSKITTKIIKKHNEDNFE